MSSGMCVIFSSEYSSTSWARAKPSTHIASWTAAARILSSSATLDAPYLAGSPSTDRDLGFV